MTDPKKLTTAEAAELTGQIASLTRSELPLVPGLIALGEEYHDGALKTSMLKLAESLEAGVPLEEAIEGRDNGLTPQIRGLIRAGLRTGRIGDLLERFAACSRIGTDLRRKFLVSLAYPAFSIAIALAIFSLISLVIVPTFESIFQDFNLPAPLLTRFLFEVSRVFRQAWPLLVALAVIGLIGWGSGFFLNAFTNLRVSMYLPLLGGIWRSTSLAQYFHLLAFLLEGGIPISEAVRRAAVGAGVGTAELEGASDEVARNLDSGRGFAPSLASVSAFPAGFSPLLKWAEGLDSLPEVLHIIAEMFEDRARSQLTFASSFIGFLSMVFILLGVSMVVLGLMLPMITLISKLSG